MTEILLKSDELLSVAQAARQLGKPKITLYRWVGLKKMIGVKLGGVIFIPVSEVERIMEAERLREAKV